MSKAHLKPHVYFSDSSLPPAMRDEFHGCNVLKLSLRPLEPLAQALDVFIVRLVLLLVHFQQRPQAFDAMLFLHHTLSVFKLAYNSTVSDCFQRFTGFYTWLNVVLGVGGKLFGLP